MKISFKWIGGATWILQIDNLKIACDPVLCEEGHIQDYKYFKTKRLNNPVYDKADFKNINLWLLTHNHEDHIDPPGFKMINKDSAIISHIGCRRYFRNDIFKDLRFLSWNEESEISFDDA
jgi:N-acyl-phosphatidylethanolamine-hydrolysing phospholipase D